MRDYVVLNHTLMLCEQAHISPDDRGFKFGDGLFETIAVVAGRLYLWKEHLARLHEGLHCLGIAYDSSALYEDSMALIHANSIHHGMVRIALSRGAGSQGYLPTHEGTPTLYIEALPTAPPGTTHPAITLHLSQWRRVPAACLPASLKIAQGMNATLARLEARAHGCDDALMLNVSGHLCEAASGNLLWLERDTLCTPDPATDCLAGTMKARLMQLWQGEVKTCTMPMNALETIDALVMSNAVRGCVAVASVRHGAQHWQFSHSDVLAQQLNDLIIKDTACAS